MGFMQKFAQKKIVSMKTTWTKPMKEIEKKTAEEIRFFKILKDPLIKKGFKFTYEEYVKEKYPELFF